MSDSEDTLVNADGTLDRKAVQNRIASLTEQASNDAATFDPPDEPPDEELARTYLIEGAGQVIGLYATVRTGGRLYSFSEEEFHELESAMNTWFQLYAACYGEEIEPAVSIRTAAQALIDTEDIEAVAQVVTDVP